MNGESGPTRSMMLAFVVILVFVAVMVLVLKRHPPINSGMMVTDIPPGVLTEALAEAQEEHKPVYVAFHATWCGACRTFEKQVLETAPVQQALKNVVFVKVDTDQERALARLFGVQYVPTGVLLEPVTDRSVRVLRVHEGVPDWEEFVEFLSVPETPTTKKAA